MRPPRKVTLVNLIQIEQAIMQMHDARANLRRAGARRSHQRLNAAIKSAEGALRHAQGAYSRLEQRQ